MPIGDTEKSSPCRCATSIACIASPPATGTRSSPSCLNTMPAGDIKYSSPSLVIGVSPRSETAFGMFDSFAGALDASDTGSKSPAKISCRPIVSPNLGSVPTSTLGWVFLSASKPACCASTALAALSCPSGASGSKSRSVLDGAAAGITPSAIGKFPRITSPIVALGSPETIGL